MQTEETFGRAKLIKKDTYNTILIKKRLEDSFDTLPRPVAHVGNEKYIMNIWNKIRNQPHKYLNDPVYIDDHLKK